VKVLIAIHGYPPTYYAGSERAAERIAQWLIAHGHHVEVFTCERLDDPDTRVETSIENGIVIHRLNYDLKTGDYFQNLYDDPRVGAAFRQVLEQNTFDVVQVVSGYLLGGQVIHAAKEAGIPVVLTLTEFWFMCFRLNLLTANNEMCIGPESDEKCMRCVLEDQRRYRLPAEKAPAVMDAFWGVAKHAPFAREQTATLARRRETLMSALNAVDLVICPSQFIMRKFGEYGFDTSRFVHLRHGLKQPPQKFKLTDNKGVLRLGFLGQIKAHKGVDLIIDAVLPLIDQGAPISLEIWGSKVGNPSYGEGLEYQTKDYPTIRWAGSYNSDQLWNILSTMDILIIPSRWYENSPTVILEAQTFGLPVITTRLGGMQELIQHEKNGLLFELNNVKDLRTQIQRLLNEPDLLAQLRAGIPNIPTIDDEVGAIYAQYQKLTSKV
jgi:glycosyltransferase involved in cell wall biosynthesis